MAVQNAHHQHPTDFLWIFPLTHKLFSDSHSYRHIELFFYSEFHQFSYPLPRQSDHKLLLLSSFYQWSSHVERVTILPQKTMKTNQGWMREGSLLQSVFIFLYIFFFSAAIISFGVNSNWIYFWLPHIHSVIFKEQSLYYLEYLKIWRLRY